MAWQLAKRVKRGLDYQDDADPKRFRVVRSTAVVHMETTEGSGEFDAPINFEWKPRNNPNINGFVINEAGFHFHVQTGPRTQSQQARGTVSFGAKRGREMWRFKLHRMGYWHRPSDGWEVFNNGDGFGAPAYGGTFSREQRAVRLGEETLNREASMKWSGIWTPGSGNIDFEIKLSNFGILPEIVFDQAARDALPSFTTPADRTFLEFRFQLTPGNVRLRKGGTLRPDGFDEEDDEEIQLEDAGADVLGFLNRGVAYVRGAPGRRVRLRRRIWFDGSQWWYAYGLRMDRYATMLPGTLVIDPSITQEQVGASADDGYEFYGTAYNGGSNVYAGQVAGSDNWALTRFTSVPVPADSTIDDCEWGCVSQGVSGSPDIDFHMEIDAAAIVNLASNDISNRTITTASVNVTTWPGFGSSKTVDMTTVMQEVVDDAAWSEDDDLAVVIQPSGSGGNVTFRAYDGTAGDAATLDCTYTAGGGGSSVPVFYHHYRQMSHHR